MIKNLLIIVKILIGFILLYFIIANITHIYFKNKSIISNCYFYENNDGKNCIKSKCKNKYVIYGDIIDYDFNKNYAIILQIPSIFSYDYLRETSNQTDSFNYPKFTYQEQMLIDNTNIYNCYFDSLLSPSIYNLMKKYTYFQNVFKNEYNYYIILRQNDSLVGPLTKKVYEQKRLEFKIPNKLQLKELDE